MPRYEFVEGTSSKFWEITLEDGDTVRTRWGRIGAEGQEKVEPCASRADALKVYEKAIHEKTSKGYTLATPGGGPATAPNPALEARILKDLDGTDAYLAYGEWLRSQQDPRGELIALQAARPEKSSSRLNARETALVEKHKDALLGEAAGYTEALELEWHLGFIKGAAVRLSYDDDVNAEEHVLPALFHSPSARFLRELTLGCVSFDGENDYGGSIRAIVKHAPRTLSALFLGDFDSDECELSWSSLGNAEPLWEALPGLERVKLRAGSMTLGKIVLPECRSFTVETGGLSRASMKSIAAATWPRLEALEVWFGAEDYGGECGMKDVQPVLDGKGLPMLRRLGLNNAEFTTELVAALPQSKILKQLTHLDLSKGTLGDEAVDALLEAKAAYAHLEKLDLRENCLSAEAVKRLSKLGAFVDASDQRDDDFDDPEDRYVAVGE